MVIKVETITGPAHLASALINGDTSGLDESGEADLAHFLDYIEGYSIVSTTEDEPWFTWSFELHGGRNKGGMVIDYIAHKIEEIE